MKILMSVNCSISSIGGQTSFSELFPLFWLQVFAGHDIAIVGSTENRALSFPSRNPARITPIDTHDLPALRAQVAESDVCLAVLPNRTGKKVVRLATRAGKPVFGYVRGDHFGAVVHRFRRSWRLPAYAAYAATNEHYLRRMAGRIPFIHVGEALRRKYAGKATSNVCIFVNDVRREHISPPRTAEASAMLHFICVGRFTLEKGVDRLPAFFRGLLHEPGASARLSVIGDGPLKPAVMQQLQSIRELDVLDHGFVSDRERLFELLRQAHYFVLLSRTEGLPKTSLEAAACGNGLLCTDVGSIRDMYGNANCGVILPNRDAPLRDPPLRLHTLLEKFPEYSRNSVALARTLCQDQEVDRTRTFISRIIGKSLMTPGE